MVFLFPPCRFPEELLPPVSHTRTLSWSFFSSSISPDMGYVQGHEDLGMELAGSGGLTTLVIDMAVMKLDFRILGGTRAS